jgi:hypothetical protein
MEFTKFKQKAAELKETVGHIEEAALAKITESLEEFNKTIPTVKALGLSVKEVRIHTGMVPEITARLTGSVESLDPEKIQELIAKNQDKEFVVLVLRGLQSASHLKEQLAELSFKGVEANLKLGIPPNVAVRLLE